MDTLRITTPSGRQDAEEFLRPHRANDSIMDAIADLPAGQAMILAIDGTPTTIECICGECAGSGYVERATCSHIGCCPCDTSTVPCPDCSDDDGDGEGIYERMMDARSDREERRRDR